MLNHCGLGWNARDVTRGNSFGFAGASAVFVMLDSWTIVLKEDNRGFSLLVSRSSFL
jgi:hypothetical protein